MTSAARRRPRTALVVGAVAALAAISTGSALAQGHTQTQGHTSAAQPAAVRYHFDADHAGAGLARQQGIAPAVAPGMTANVASVRGLDVSAYQGAVNWSAVRSGGARFAYIKATEGNGYVSSQFGQQYVGSYHAGLIRGAYHFALPNLSSGAAQADYFLHHGGGWSGDGKTLPGALDIEYNPYGATCYGFSHSGMVGWITSFVNEYHARTTRWPVIYSTTDWWTSCTGNYGGLAHNDPLWLARYGGSPGPLPAGWRFYTVWQNASTGTFPGDQDVFNGAYAQLQVLAKG